MTKSAAILVQISVQDVQSHEAVQDPSNIVILQEYRLKRVLVAFGLDLSNRLDILDDIEHYIEFGNGIGLDCKEKRIFNFLLALLRFPVGKRITCVGGAHHLQNLAVLHVLPWSTSAVAAIQPFSPFYLTLRASNGDEVVIDSGLVQT